MRGLKLSTVKLILGLRDVWIEMCEFKYKLTNGTIFLIYIMLIYKYKQTMFNVHKIFREVISYIMKTFV